MMSPNMSLLEGTKVVSLLGPIVPSTSTCDFVSLKGYDTCTILINVANLAAGATGSAVTLTQAQDVANTAGKALAFSTAYRSLNTGPAGTTDTWSSFTVSSNTFTTNTDASNNHMYAIEIRATDLDINNNFDCVRLNLANATNSTCSPIAILWPAKYGKLSSIPAITD